MSNEVPLLFSSCIPVKGAKKSIICDLQRNSYVAIPNDLYEILLNYRGLTIDQIKLKYENKYDQIIDNYFNLLLQNEFAFLTNTPELFPEMDIKWDEPFEISNAVFDITDIDNYDICKAIRELSELRCKFLQIRFYSIVSLTELRLILDFFDTVKSNTIGLDLIFPFNESISNNEITDLFDNYPRINTIVISSSPQGKNIQQIEGSKYCIHTSVAINSENCCGVIDKSMFSINVKTFTESLSHNSCLNRKIAINKFGEIKNCPSMTKSYGNISSIKLKDALNHTDFKKLWSLGKDQVKICQDCEFRYICTDCRAYTENRDPFGKPLKCGYDPYKGEWYNLDKNKFVELYK